MSTDDPRTSAAIIPYRDPSGRFTSDNNPGRIPGTKNRVSNEALQAVRNMKDEAIQQLREKLIAGDWNALQFVLERILPRGRLVELNDASPADVKAALVNGTLTASEAKDVATALSKLAEIGELAEIKAKLLELERATLRDGK